MEKARVTSDRPEGPSSKLPQIPQIPAPTSAAGGSLQPPLDPEVATLAETWRANSQEKPLRRKPGEGPGLNCPGRLSAGLAPSLHLRDTHRKTSSMTRESAVRRNTERADATLVAPPSPPIRIPRAVEVVTPSVGSAPDHWSRLRESWPIAGAVARRRSPAPGTGSSSHFHQAF